MCMGKEHNSHLASRTCQKVRRLLERIHECVGRKNLLWISVYARCGDPIAKSTSDIRQKQFSAGFVPPLFKFVESLEWERTHKCSTTFLRHHLLNDKGSLGARQWILAGKLTWAVHACARVLLHSNMCSIELDCLCGGNGSLLKFSLIGLNM